MNNPNDFDLNDGNFNAEEFGDFGNFGMTTEQEDSVPQATNPAPTNTPQNRPAPQSRPASQRQGDGTQQGTPQGRPRRPKSPNPTRRRTQGLPNPNEPVRRPQSREQASNVPLRQVNPQPEEAEQVAEEVSQEQTVSAEPPKKKKKGKVVAIAIASLLIVGIGGGVAYKKLNTKEPPPPTYIVETKYEDTGRYPIDNYVTAINAYNAEEIKNLCSNSWLAQEWKYANSNSLRENWIRSVCSYLEVKYPQVQAVDNLGNPAVDASGNAVMEEATMLNGETLTVTVVDFETLGATMQEDIDIITRAYKESGYASTDYTYQDEMADLMLDYLLNKSNFPTKEVEVKVLVDYDADTESNTDVFTDTDVNAGTETSEYSSDESNESVSNATGMVHKSSGWVGSSTLLSQPLGVSGNKAPIMAVPLVNDTEGATEVDDELADVPVDELTGDADNKETGNSDDTAEPTKESTEDAENTSEGVSEDATNATEDASGSTKTATGTGTGTVTTTKASSETTTRGTNSYTNSDVDGLTGNTNDKDGLTDSSGDVPAMKDNEEDAVSEDLVIYITPATEYITNADGSQSSVMRYKITDDSALDKLMFSSEEFHNMIDTYGELISKIEYDRETERIATLKAEYDARKTEAETLAEEKLATLQEEARKTAEEEGLTEEEIEKRVAEVELPEEDQFTEEWVEPERTLDYTSYIPESVVQYTWVGAYHAQHEYKGESNKKAQVGDGTFDLPAGLGTTLVTKAMGDDGQYHDVKVTLQGYYLGENAVKYALSFSEKNRGFDATSQIKLICYEMKVENLEDAPITISSEMFLSDAQSNQSAKTGNMYGFYTTATIQPHESEILNDWATSTEMEQKYVCWGKSFDRQFPVLWFRLLAGSGEEVPQYDANESYVNRERGNDEERVYNEQTDGLTE